MDANEDVRRGALSSRNTRRLEREGNTPPLVSPFEDPEQVIRDARRANHPAANSADETVPASPPPSSQDSLPAADRQPESLLGRALLGRPTVVVNLTQGHPPPPIQVEEIQETKESAEDESGLLDLPEETIKHKLITEAKEVFIMESRSWLDEYVPKLVGSLVAEFRLTDRDEVKQMVEQRLKDWETSVARPFLERTVRAYFTSPTLVGSITRQMLSDPETVRDLTAFLQSKVDGAIAQGREATPPDASLV